MNGSGTFQAQVFALPSIDAADTALAQEQTVHAPATAPNFVGLAFSGGGSRALSAALGQMRGLRHLGLLDEAFFISSVSGGSWATALYTFLPAEYDDDDFLGHVVENPGDLTFDNWDHRRPWLALDYLPPHNLGHVPGRLGFLHDLELILQLKYQYGYANHDLWQGLIGHAVLKPWGLWNPDDRGFPNRYYSYSDAYLSAPGGILQRNRQLGTDDFYTIQRNRPLYVMNASLVSNPTLDGSQLYPFESSPVGAGVRGSFPGIGPDGREIGGGLLEPFAMGSTWLADLPSTGPGAVSVSTPGRPFSLSDMVGISSAAFAKMAETSHLKDLHGLVPRYHYWPVQGREQPENAAYPYLFADGGNLENTGITALLSRKLPNVIAFVNSQTPLRLDATGDIVVDAQIQLLFGKPPTVAALMHDEPYRDPIPNHDTGFVQVFPTDRYPELAQGLWSANQAGGTAMYMQTLPVLPNANFGIRGNYTVRVLWVYNTAVRAWDEQLRESVWLYRERLRNFPNYDTVLQLELSPREVNLLASLSCWNVISSSELGHPGTTNAEMFRTMFYG